MKSANVLIRRPAAFVRPLLSALLCAATVAAFAPRTLAQEPRVRTDRAVHAEPTLPTLPAAGGIYVDPVFGVEIMRATDSGDQSSPGCGTFYNQWPTLNSNNTYLLIRCGVSGDMMIKSFDGATFSPGSVVRKTWGGGSTQVPYIGGEYARWEGATWSRTDPDKIWVVPAAPNSGGSTARGPQIYTYSVSSNTYTHVKDFTGIYDANEFFYEYHFAGTHADGDYDVFTASVLPEVNDSAAHWLAWRRTGDSVIFNHDNGGSTHFNVCLPDKAGAYIYCGPDSGYTTRVIYQTSNPSNTQTFGTEHATLHGDAGSVYSVGRSANGAQPQQRRTMSDWTNTALTLTLFDWKDANGSVDASNDCHTSLMADDQDWVLQGCYDDISATGTETGAFEDEILRIKMDGSQSVRRLLHTRTRVTNVDGATNGYRAIPHPTVSRDGRYIAYTSNWEDSGRTDMFIALAPNVDESTFFVRQHYRDFLGRGGDASGVGFWRNDIEQCGANASCRDEKRVNVSAAFFLSIEFQQTGYLAYRAWGAAFGPTRVEGRWALTRAEFLPDVSLLNQNVVVGATGWEAQLEANKVAYFNAFVAREAFTTLYPTTMTPTQYVDALNQTSGYHLSLAERDQLIADLTNQTKTRAGVLRALTEDSDFVYWQNNRAFVVMEYFGYLRRDPDTSGYDYWYYKLNQFNGNYVAAEMVKGFLESLEYRSRFGQ
jgi:hypothetical protein